MTSIPKEWRPADKLTRPVNPYDEQPPDWCLPVEDDEPLRWWERVCIGLAFGTGLVAAIVLAVM